MTKKRNMCQYQRRIKKRFEIIDVFGGQCQSCGFSDKRALTFHHTGKKEGKFDYLYKENWKNLRLLCWNCHKLVHYTNNKIPLMPITIKN